MDAIPRVVDKLLFFGASFLSGGIYIALDVVWVLGVRVWCSLVLGFLCYDWVPVGWVMVLLLFFLPFSASELTRVASY